MNKTILAAIALAIPSILSAQSAIDAFTLSQTETRGTARFMSMGGAFTALGGDLSTLTQNPAGIGVYRRSEIGATLDISPRSVSARTASHNVSTSSTTVSCNNFGYVGTVNLGGTLETFSWGASYNRAASFNRRFTAYQKGTGTSLTNYVADYSTAIGYPPSMLEFGQGNYNNYDPYIDSDADWLSILSYNSFMINPTAGGGYSGLYQNGSFADYQAEVHESGYVDEYAIDFGGNISNKLMWGIGFGITDLQYHRSSYYSEGIDDALICTTNGGMTTGQAQFWLDNFKTVSGTGFNLKLGLIFKPINEFRVGVAFHTPTWYTLTSNGYGEVDYNYYDPNNPDNRTNVLSGNEYTDNSFYNFRLTSPWKFMAGAAFVLGSTAIISADYEYQAYDKIRVSYQDRFGVYISDDYVKQDVEDYYRAANIVRVGAEVRLTSSFSVRAGYSYTSATASNYMLGGAEVVTDSFSTDPSYTMNRSQNSVSVGLGYRYKAFYIDGAYIYRNKKSVYKPYTDYGAVLTPRADLTENINSIVLSAGFRF